MLFTTSWVYIEASRMFSLSFPLFPDIPDIRDSIMMLRYAGKSSEILIFQSRLISVRVLFLNAKICSDSHSDQFQSVLFSLFWGVQPGIGFIF